MMNEEFNYFESELLRDLGREIDSGTILIVADSSSFFSEIKNIFPIWGSKIQWSRVPGAIESSEPNSELQTQAAIDFFKSMTFHQGLKGTVIYAGDSAVNFALLAPVEEFANHLDSLLSIPQHHYFVAEDFSWVMVFSFEGHMAFGKRPS